jgi:hypothetical protein
MAKERTDIADITDVAGTLQVALLVREWANMSLQYSLMPGHRA